jgi:hypothetical protein
MKYTYLVVSISLLMFCSCSILDAGQSRKPLAMPVGKNWQVIEEAPNLSDERGRLPFQTEQSVQPEGTTKPVSPADKRKIVTPH